MDRSLGIRPPALRKVVLRDAEGSDSGSGFANRARSWPSWVRGILSPTPCRAKSDGAWTSRDLIDCRY